MTELRFPSNENGSDLAAIVASRSAGAWHAWLVVLHVQALHEAKDAKKAEQRAALTWRASQYLELARRIPPEPLPEARKMARLPKNRDPIVRGMFPDRVSVFKALRVVAEIDTLRRGEGLPKHITTETGYVARITTCNPFDINGANVYFERCFQHLERAEAWAGRWVAIALQLLSAWEPEPVLPGTTWEERQRLSTPEAIEERRRWLRRRRLDLEDERHAKDESARLAALCKGTRAGYAEAAKIGDRMMWYGSDDEDIE